MPIADRLPPDVADALADFRTVTVLPVQWGDMDAFGHVNNAVYFRWFESARIDLLDSFQSEVSMASGGIAPILASIRCDYKKQLHYPDTVYIGSRTGPPGRTSVEIQHAVYSRQLRQVAAVGTSVMVVFDYQANRPVRIPDELKQQLEQQS
ncbi:MAG: thioesterase family protein [Planctomycetaceae bacterium]